MSELCHAILIEGGSEDARTGKAMELLIAHFSDDPMAERKLKDGVFEDLIIIEREDGRDIILELIDDYLVPFFKQKPFASTGRACLIPHGERMPERTQNHILKLLEEPAAGNLIIILTENAERLLPTVKSRCMRVWLGYEAQDEGVLSDDIKELASMLIYGKRSLAEAGAILSRYDGSPDEATGFLRAFQLFLRSLSVGRYSADLIGGGSEYSGRLGEAAGKLQNKHADLMLEGVMLAEKAQSDIEKGYRIRYALRGMALRMRLNADSQGGY